MNVEKLLFFYMFLIYQMGSNGIAGSQHSNPGAVRKALSAVDRFREARMLVVPWDVHSNMEHVRTVRTF